MGNDGGEPLDPDLRRRAIERLRERKLAQNLSLRDPDGAVHELEVHQVELELQNAELREARIELEQALARYTEIFDLAPIGYVTLAPDGSIRETNHAAARLLGGFRAQLLGKSFAAVVLAPYRAQFSELLRLALSDGVRESCALQLLRFGAGPFTVKLTATLLARAEPLVLLTLQELNEGGS